jgi:hypothetical protein
MNPRLAALAVLGAALVLPQSAAAQSAMCAAPALDLQAARTAPQAQAPSPLREEDLPWCAGAEDPRCAPLHGDSTALVMALRQPLAAATSAVPPRCRAIDDCKFTPRMGLVPCVGISNRVERPPRPIR